MRIATLLVAFITFTGIAHADPPAETPTTPAPTIEKSYRLEMLVADAGILLAGAPTGGVLSFGWLATGAIVHASHGNAGRAAGSVLMRLSFPVIGALAGAASASGCSGEFCGLGAAMGGALIGMGTAEVVDLVLASDRVEAPIGPAPRWSPVVAAHSSGVSLGVAGHF